MTRPSLGLDVIPLLSRTRLQSSRKSFLGLMAENRVFSLLSINTPILCAIAETSSSRPDLVSRLFLRMSCLTSGDRMGRPEGRRTDRASTLLQDRRSSMRPEHPPLSRCGTVQRLPGHPRAEVLLRRSPPVTHPCGSFVLGYHHF